MFRSRIEAFQGRVIDMAGDSVLAVFDLASGATAAARAIQEEFAGSTAKASSSSRAVVSERGHPSEVAVEHLGDTVRAEMFRHRRESDEIHEHHGDHATLGRLVEAELPRRAGRTSGGGK